MGYAHHPQHAPGAVEDRRLEDFRPPLFSPDKVAPFVANSLTGLYDFPVLLADTGVYVGRHEIELGTADNIAGFPANAVCKRAIDGGVASLEILGPCKIRKVVEQCPMLTGKLLGLDFGLVLVVVVHGDADQPLAATLFRDFAAYQYPAGFIVRASQAEGIREAVAAHEAGTRIGQQIFIILGDHEIAKAGMRRAGSILLRGCQGPQQPFRIRAPADQVGVRIPFPGNDMRRFRRDAQQLGIV